MQYTSNNNLATFQLFCEAQGGRCAVCQRYICAVLDHCHNCGEIRGAVCEPCNYTFRLMSKPIYTKKCDSLQ